MLSPIFLYAEKKTYLKARYLSALLVYVDNWKGCASYIGCDACPQVPDEARMNMHQASYLGCGTYSRVPDQTRMSMHQASYKSGHILGKNQRAASPKKRGHIFFNFKGHIFFHATLMLMHETAKIGPISIRSIWLFLVASSVPCRELRL